MISRGVEISNAGGVVAMVRVLSLSPFFFFFFFCNKSLIFFMYKNPHAALAMERTKPINQKHKQRKVTAPVKYPLIAQVSPPPGHWPHITRKARTNNLARLERQAYIRQRKENPATLYLR